MPAPLNIGKVKEAEIIKERQLGLPNKDIAEKYGISESSCTRIWKRHLEKEVSMGKLEIAAVATDKVKEALKHTDVRDKEDRAFVEKVWKDSMPDEKKTEVNTSINVGVVMFGKEDAPKAEEMFKGRVIDVQDKEEDE